VTSGHRQRARRRPRSATDTRKVPPNRRATRGTGPLSAATPKRGVGERTGTGSQLSHLAGIPSASGAGRNLRRTRGRCRRTVGRLGGPDLPPRPHRSGALVSGQDPGVSRATSPAALRGRHGPKPAAHAAGGCRRTVRRPLVAVGRHHHTEVGWRQPVGLGDGRRPRRRSRVPGADRGLRWTRGRRRRTVGRLAVAGR
jgi:hypothetical protein